MNSPDDLLFDHRIADWLEQDPKTAPSSALDVVLAAFPSVPQRRTWRASWRSADREWFRGLLNDVLAAGRADAEWAEVDRGEQADLAMESYFSDLVADRRQQPEDDLLSALVAARDGDDRMSEMELLNTAALLLASVIPRSLPARARIGSKP